MAHENNTQGMPPTMGERVPGPPAQCVGRLYTVRAGDTLFLIARRFGVTLEQIRTANPQITNPDLLIRGQVICIPTGAPPQPDGGQLRVLSVRFFTESGQQISPQNGAIELLPRVIVRAAFNRPVSRAFFFLEPTGTATCELARLIGVDCPSAVTGVAEILWQVPAGTLGRVFVVACLNSICAKSDEVLVVRNNQ